MRLTLPLNAVYFDQIAAGLKVEEYRLATPFWRRRIAGRAFDAVVLTRGYPKGGGVEGVTRLTRVWRGSRIVRLTHEHFGPDPVDVFAIDVATPAYAPSPPTLASETNKDRTGREGREL